MTWTQVHVWKKHVDTYIAGKTKLIETLKKAYLLIYGQCTDPLHAKLQALLNHKDIAADSYALLWLLENIKAMMFHLQLQ